MQDDGLDAQLGAVAHRGGIIAEHETLRVGIAQMVSRTSGLQVTVVARRPADRRSTAERQAAIRARDKVAAAPRRLLPSFDEGTDLRLGWLDTDGRARWSYPQSSQGDSGGSARDAPGPRLRATFVLPPIFGAMTLLLGWPGIGFPETSIELDLPDVSTVDQASVSIWDAALPDTRTPSWSREVLADAHSAPKTAEETYTAIAPPQTLLRSMDAALVLSWLSADDTMLHATVTGVAHGPTADHLGRAQFPPLRSSDAEPEPFPGRCEPVFGVVQNDLLMTFPAVSGSSTGGPGSFQSETTFTLPRPAGHQPFQLAVGWPRAGLSTVEVLLAGL